MGRELAGDLVHHLLGVGIDVGHEGVARLILFELLPLLGAQAVGLARRFVLGLEAVGRVVRGLFVAVELLDVRAGRLRRRGLGAAGGLGLRKQGLCLFEVLERGVVGLGCGGVGVLGRLDALIVLLDEGLDLGPGLVVAEQPGVLLLGAALSVNEAAVGVLEDLCAARLEPLLAVDAVHGGHDAQDQDDQEPHQVPTTPGRPGPRRTRLLGTIHGLTLPRGRIRGRCVAGRPAARASAAPRADARSDP